MTLFFLLVGLEIKREMLVDGQLSNWRQRILPGIAALGERSSNDPRVGNTVGRHYREIRARILDAWPRAEYLSGDV